MMVDGLIFAAVLAACVGGLELVRRGIADAPQGAEGVMRVVAPAPYSALLLVAYHACPFLDLTALSWWTVGLAAMGSAYYMALAPLDVWGERWLYPVLDAITQPRRRGTKARAAVAPAARTAKRRRAKQPSREGRTAGFHPDFVFTD